MNIIAECLGLGAALIFPSIAFAYSDGVIADFESEKGYTAVGVYDCWEQSPFRTGRLAGNVAVVANPFAGDDGANASGRVLAAQRSRYAGNRFGVRVDLEEPFEITPTARYVHVLIHTPKRGRAMLVGLGSRRERLEQDPGCEQFWELSVTAAGVGRWYDAVFPVRGAGGIDIRSLVIVPDCESPHDLAEDFIFYVDDIEISDSARPRVTDSPYYPISGDKGTLTLARPDRFATAVSLIGSADVPVQTFAVPQDSDKHVYFDLTDSIFTARPGDALTISVFLNGEWKQGRCSIDYDSDGRFDAGTDSGPAEPPLSLPADLAPGMYRVRCEADWGGDGVIADFMLHVHGATVLVNDNQLNGEVLAADGDGKLNSLAVPFGQDFKIRMNPEKGFTHDGFTMLCGYDFAGAPVDRMGNRRYFRHVVPASDIAADGTYVIPARLMSLGNVMILGNMREAEPAAGLSTETTLQ